MFPAELDDEMLTWILALRDLHFPMSVLRFQKKAKLLIQLHNSSFSASCGWVDKFFTRKTEPVFQSAKSCCVPFHLLVIWMKNQYFLIWAHQNALWRKVTEYVVRSSGSEKKHLTILLLATAFGQMLPPTIIFRGKTDLTIRNLIIPLGLIVKTHKKAWIGYGLMKTWVEEI